VEKLRAAGVRTITIPSSGGHLAFGRSPLLFSSYLSLARKADYSREHSKRRHRAVANGFLEQCPHVFTAHAWAFNEKRSGLSKALIMFFTGSPCSSPIKP